MNASKENAAKASIHLKELANFLDPPEVFDEELNFLAEFLKAAQRKLPSEAAFERQKMKTKAEK